ARARSGRHSSWYGSRPEACRPTMGRASLLSRTIYATVPANLVTLCMARGPYVTVWDLSGATFAVLALPQGSITDGVHALLAHTLNQQRPVFTGGECLIYDLI